MESVEPSIKMATGAIDVLSSRIRHFLWRGRGRAYAEGKIAYYNKLGAGIELAPLPPGDGQALPMKPEKPPVTDAPAAEETAVVMCTMNALSYTKQAIASLRENASAPFKFYFVDNGSIDGTASFLSTVPDSTLFRLEENTGVAEGRNRGAREALANPDALEQFRNLARLNR